MGPYRHVATAAVALLAAIGCGVPLRVNAYAERGADLGRYRTYDFGPVEEAPTGDPRLDSNPFFNERIRVAAATGLAGRGFERVSSGAADFVVHFHASVVQDIDVDEVDRQRGYCPEAGCKPFAYDSGTLVLDVVDSRTGKIVWRGWAESSFEGLVDNQSWLEERIDIAVERIIAKMPRRAP